MLALVRAFWPVIWRLGLLLVLHGGLRFGQRYLRRAWRWFWA